MKKDSRHEIINNLKRYYKGMVREFEYELLRASTSIEMKAKSRVPVDIAGIKKSIYSDSKNIKKNLTAEVGATEEYAPYVEFGTGKYVKVDNEFKDLAMTFYVNGQGRTKPRPFLIPAFYEERKKFIENIKGIVNKYSK